jgi:hypothetical protein
LNGGQGLLMWELEKELLKHMEFDESLKKFDGMQS